MAKSFSILIAICFTLGKIHVYLEPKSQETQFILTKKLMMIAMYFLLRDIHVIPLCFRRIKIVAFYMELVMCKFLIELAVSQIFRPLDKLFNFLYFRFMDLFREYRPKSPQQPFYWFACELEEYIDHEDALQNFSILCCLAIICIILHVGRSVNFKLIKRGNWFFVRHCFRRMWRGFIKALKL